MSSTRPDIDSTPHRGTAPAVSALASERDPFAGFRRILFAIFALAAAGVFTELILLEHTESLWQLIPIVALPIGLALIIGAAIRPSRLMLKLLQSMMLLFIVSGGVGLYLHYEGNVEFELEMMPSLGGLKLFWEAITGATPALAPGTMAQLGLLGLLYTYKHPALAGPASVTSTSSSS